MVVPEVSRSPPAVVTATPPTTVPAHSSGTTVWKHRASIGGPSQVMLTLGGGLADQEVLDCTVLAKVSSTLIVVVSRVAPPITTAGP